MWLKAINTEEGLQQRLLIEYRTSIKHDRALCDRVSKFEFDSHKKVKKKTNKKTDTPKTKKIWRACCLDP